MNLEPFHFVYDNWCDTGPVANLIDPEDCLVDPAHLCTMWPYIVPCPVEDYCKDHDYPVIQHDINSAYPDGSLYPIGIGRFDARIDYMQLIPEPVKQAARSHRLLLFFYSREGGDPQLQKSVLVASCEKHQLPQNCYRFITGNTKARNRVEWFYQFTDAELHYRNVNQSHVACQMHQGPRIKDFTVLARTHRAWRALVMCGFSKHGILKNAFWSYGNSQPALDDRYNPIDIEQIDDLEPGDVAGFLASAPYRCDDLPLSLQADHSTLVETHFVDSYLHVILESAIDTHGGSWLTANTFKPIKHGQPFVIMGPIWSLRLLQYLGYRTFDGIIDNSYDDVWNHTKRWKKVLSTLQDIQSQGVQKVFDLCWSDIEHNQKHFLANKQHRLRLLYDMLTAHYFYNNNTYEVPIV